MAAPSANGTGDGATEVSLALISSNGHSEAIHQNGSKNSKKNDKEAERRRRRRKQKKKAGNHSEDKNSTEEQKSTEDIDENETDKVIEDHVEVEYVSEKPDFDESFIENFSNVFEKFKPLEEIYPALQKDEDSKEDSLLDKAKQVGSDEEDEDEQDAKQKEKGMSNKKKKLQRRMKIAELKQQCSRPDVVEVWDATAADPKLLVFLKAYRNTVPVPRHWCQKRKFLQDAALQQS